MIQKCSKFQADLLQSVRDIKAGRVGRVHLVGLTAAAQARIKSGLSQTGFADLLGSSAKPYKTGNKAAPSPVAQLTP